MTTFKSTIYQFDSFFRFLCHQVFSFSSSILLIVSRMWMSNVKNKKNIYHWGFYIFSYLILILYFQFYLKLVEFSYNKISQSLTRAWPPYTKTKNPTLSMLSFVFLSYAVMSVCWKNTLFLLGKIVILKVH